MTNKQKFNWGVVFTLLIGFTGLSVFSFFSPFKFGPTVTLAQAMEDQKVLVMFSDLPQMPEIKLIKTYMQKSFPILHCQINRDFINQIQTALGIDSINGNTLVLDQNSLQQISGLGDPELINCQTIQKVLNIPFLMPSFSVS